MRLCADKFLSRLAVFLIPIILAGCGKVGGREFESGVVREYSDPPLDIGIALQSESITTAQQLPIRIEVRAPDGLRIKIPREAELRSDFDVGQYAISRSVSRRDGRLLWEVRIKLEPTVPGKYEIPALEFTAEDEEGILVAKVNTQPIPITVESILDQGGTVVGTTNIIATLSSLPDIREIHPPIEKMPGNPWRIVFLSLAVFIGLAIPSVLLWRRHLAQIGEKRALGELAKLEKAGVIEAGEVRSFYLRLNRILRKYIQRCYGIALTNKVPAVIAKWLGPECAGAGCRLSRTNRELISDLKPRVTDEEGLNEIYSVLQDCDLVKFAEKNPGAESARRALAASFEFVGKGIAGEQKGARR